MPKEVGGRGTPERTTSGKCGGRANPPDSETEKAAEDEVLVPGVVPLRKQTQSRPMPRPDG